MHVSDQNTLIEDNGVAFLLDRIQNQLECIYGIALPQRVKDFVINREEAAQFITINADTKIPKELFLVKQASPDSVEVALFLDTELLRNLKINDPFVSLNHNNLSDFCILIEGISHFVYFLWKAEKEVHVTQLEMEMQAEVDKFLMLFFYLKTDHSGALPHELFNALFEDYKLFDNLTEECKDRYLTASTLASKYCSRLQKQFPSPKKVTHLIEEIRIFYALSQEQKIRHIVH